MRPSKTRVPEESMGAVARRRRRAVPKEDAETGADGGTRMRPKKNNEDAGEEKMARAEGGG